MGSGTSPSPIAVGDVDESSPLVADDADAYGVTKRDTDAALAEVEGITRVLLRPPAVLGPGASSIWNTLRPARMREDETARHAVPDQTFAWCTSTTSRASPPTWRVVACRPRATRTADLFPEGALPSTSRPGRPRPATTTGPSRAHSASSRSGTTVLRGPGKIRAERARGWGWAPSVDLAEALAEIVEGLRH